MVFWLHNSERVIFLSLPGLVSYDGHAAVLSIAREE